ncbi:MAG: hypothetical protein AAFR61_22680 [Bacteroidota bacterium]
MRQGPKSFPTRNGYCQVFSDRIEIHTDGLAGQLSRWFYSKGIRRVSIFYVLSSLAFLIASFVAIGIGNWFLAVFFFLAVALSVYALFINRQNSIAPLILRKDIDKVDYQAAVKGESRAAFTIFFKDHGKAMKRRVPLPSLMQNGAEIANTAFWIMRDAGLVSNS